MALNKNKTKEYQKEYYKKYYTNAERKAFVNENNKKRQKILKDMVFNFYGWICNCCGETGRSFLVIDHVNNDGYKDLAKAGYKRTGNVLYRYIIDNNFPDKYQVLCWNCNSSKHLNNGTCEHKILNNG